MPKVDLFLGGRNGAFALGFVEPEQIATVITLDEYLVETARKRGIAALIGDAKRLDYETASIGFSVHYPRLFSPELLAEYERVYNIHPGFLPWGRGYYPVFWALWEGTPAGATLHVIDEGIDTGPVVDQRAVPVLSDDTGGSFYKRVAQAERDLFTAWWPRIVAGEEVPTRPQAEGIGTYHERSEFFLLKKGCPYIWTHWYSKRLIHLTRCLTFPGYTGLEVELDGKRWHLRLERMDE